MILGRDSYEGGDGGIDGDKNVPYHHAARNGNNVVFGPVVRYQCSLAEDGKQDRGVHGRTPNPVTGYLSVGLHAVVGPHELTSKI